MKNSRIRQVPYLLARCHCSCLRASHQSTTCVSACGGLGSKKLRLEIQSGSQGAVGWVSLCCLSWSWGNCLSPCLAQALAFLEFATKTQQLLHTAGSIFLAIQCYKPAGCSQKQVDNVVLFYFRCLCFILGGCTMQKETFRIFILFFLKSLT